MCIDHIAGRNAVDADKVEVDELPLLFSGLILVYRACRNSRERVIIGPIVLSQFLSRG